MNRPRRNQHEDQNAVALKYHLGQNDPEWLMIYNFGPPKGYCYFLHYLLHLSSIVKRLFLVVLLLP
jgi:hypothetical protein